MKILRYDDYAIYKTHKKRWKRGEGMVKKRCIALLLCMCMIFVTLTGCANKKDSDVSNTDVGSTEEVADDTKAEDADPTAVPEVVKEDPYGKMEPEIEQSGIRINTGWMLLDEGDDVDNNVWSRAVKDILGITLKQKWTASDWGAPFDEKVNLAIATDDMPDIAALYTSLFYRAVDNDRVADLTEAYEKFASPRLREYMEMSDGAALKSVTYDGKIMGLAAPPDSDAHTFLWLRQDWLDKLGLKAPTTLDELFQIAEAFATQDPNGNGMADEIGLALTKNFFGGRCDVEKLFWAYDLYPRKWVEKDGEITRGELLPENKVLLNKFAELYAKGVIAKDFAIKDPNVEVEEDIASGKVGICFGAFNLVGAPSLVASHENTGAEWTAYKMPTITGDPIIQPMETRITNFVVAGNKNKSPEAVVKMINLQLEIDAFNSQFVSDNTFNMSPTNNMNFWCKPAFGISAPNVETDRGKHVSAALRGTLDPATLNLSEKETYDKYKDYVANKTLENWAIYTMYKEGGSADQLVKPEVAGVARLTPDWWPETPAWTQYGQDISTKVQEYFINAVVSGDVDGEFDKWLNYYNSQGGADIQTEYNAKYQEYKK
jgi:putative aldouronate transport system substrate-binding protein